MRTNSKTPDPSLNGNSKPSSSSISLTRNRLAPRSATANSLTSQTPGKLSHFDQPVILQQTPAWSRGIVWTIIGVTTGLLIWASVAKIEEAIPATGKLEPQGSVQSVKAPEGGVVRKIYVRDGQRVKKGQLLLAFDPTVPTADLKTLNQQRAALLQENQFYNAKTKGGTPAGAPGLETLASLRDRLVQENQFYSSKAQGQTAQGNTDSNLESLAQLRSALIAENQFYQAQLNGGSPQSQTNSEFAENQRQLLAANRGEVNSRIAAAQLKVQELRKRQNQVQGQLASARKLLALNQGILNKLAPVAKEGAISQVQYQRQQQEVLTRQAEVDNLSAEQQRLAIEIAQAGEEAQNTTAVSSRDVLAKIAANQKQIADIDAQFGKAGLENQKQIADIDTQFGKAALENQKRLTEIEGQLSKAKLALQYQELRAPVDGTVFDLKATAPGFVASASEPVLNIVPNDTLVAQVYITNRDIGFVREGMDVDVKVDSYPSSEFGDIKGKIVWLGSDALPPTEVRPYYSFPAKVQLASQALVFNDRKLPLQSGMSVNTSIKVRKRTVMSIFTDLFAKEVDSVKTIR